MEPPCDTCRPITMPENEAAIMLYSIVQNQWIMGPGGPVDINHLPVWEVIDRHRISDPTGTFRKIIVLSRWMLDRINDQRSP
jgi:hypothetical protein